MTSSRIERIRQAFLAADKLEGVTSETLLAAARKAVPDATREELIQVVDEQSKKIRRLSRRALSRSRPKTAIHEAGHAVASIVLGRAFDFVTIVPNDDTDGHIAHPPRPEGWHNDPQSVRDEIVILIASAAAQRLILPRSHWRADYGVRLDAVYDKKKLLDGSDHSGVLLLLREIICGRDPEAQWACYADCSRRAYSLVETHRDKIEAVAAALLEKLTLSYDDVRQITLGIVPE
jgi:cell division protease FtsH